jgi:hypothetical protein
MSGADLKKTEVRRVVHVHSILSLAFVLTFYAAFSWKRNNLKAITKQISP